MMATKPKSRTSSRSRSRRKSREKSIAVEEEQGIQGEEEQEEEEEMADRGLKVEEEEEEYEEEKEEGEVGEEEELELENEVEEEQEEEEEQQQQQFKHQEVLDEEAIQKSSGRIHQSNMKNKGKKRKLGHESDLTTEERRKVRNQQRALYEQIQLGYDLGVVPQSEETTTEALSSDAEDNIHNNNTNNTKNNNTKKKKVNFLGRVEHFRECNNLLFESVHFTREAVLDSENLDQIAKKMSQKVDQMLQVPRYDPARLVHKLKQKCMTSHGSSSFFDWKTLGWETGVCYNSIPSRVHFLLGPLHDDNCSEDLLNRKKKRTGVGRRKKNSNANEEEKAEEPEDMQKQTKTSDQLSAVDHSMKVLHKTLKHRCEMTREKKNHNLQTKILQNPSMDDQIKQEATQYFKQHGEDVNAFQHLFNPKSFTQTVENIFHFSFLVKKGEASIFSRDPTVDNITTTTTTTTNITSAKFREIANTIDNTSSNSDNNNNDHENNQNKHKIRNTNDNTGIFVRSMNHSQDMPPARQCVLSFSMKDWRNLMEAYEIKKGDLPHRKSQRRPHHHEMSQDGDKS